LGYLFIYLKRIYISVFGCVFQKAPFFLRKLRMWMTCSIYIHITVYIWFFGACLCCRRRGTFQATGIQAIQFLANREDRIAKLEILHKLILIFFFWISLATFLTILRDWRLLMYLQSPCLQQPFENLLSNGRNKMGTWPEDQLFWREE
jgi:hypothetical protein